MAARVIPNYGGTREASIPPNDWSLEADVDNNGMVDIYDLDFLINFYLIENLPRVPADFNHDGIVNFTDYAILASQWMDCDLALVRFTNDENSERECLKFLLKLIISILLSAWWHNYCRKFPNGKFGRNRNRLIRNCK